MSAFRDILALHAARYPKMEPQDYGKLAYQSAFGPAHLTQDPDRALPYLQAEWAALEPDPSPRAPEPVGNGLCRFPLAGLAAGELPLLSRLLVRTAGECRGTRADLEALLPTLAGLDVPGMGDWLACWREAGFPALRHSAAYRAAYRPHYRLLRAQYAGYFPVFSALEKLTGGPAVVAIDGRCGSGKTALAELIGSLFPCQTVHTDDFYLPFDRRRNDWREGIAGNMDLSRLREEVLLPLRAGRAVRYRPYSCQSGQFGAPVELEPGRLTVVEGSYSHHPTLAGAYDLKIFLTCPAQVQAARLQAREGEDFPAFQRLWMPLEERYFAACAVQSRSDLVLDTSFLKM